MNASLEYPITVEIFRRAQTEAVGQLISFIQQNEFGIPITLEQQPDLADIPGYYQNGRGNFWVALANGQVIGTTSLLDIGMDRAALRKMFVHENFRGSKYGTARHLLEEALHWASHVGLKEVYLGTTAAFQAAHRFYEKNGFTAIPKGNLPESFPVMAVDSKFYMIKI